MGSYLHFNPDLNTAYSGRCSFQTRDPSGIQVVITGDFFQLTPIGDDSLATVRVRVRGTTAAVSAPTRPTFAFEAGCWLEAPRHTYVLTVVHRARDACKPVPYVYCVSACSCPRVYRGHPRGQVCDDEDSRGRSTGSGTARSLWRRRLP